MKEQKDRKKEEEIYVFLKEHDFSEKKEEKIRECEKMGYLRGGTKTSDGIRFGNPKITEQGKVFMKEYAKCMKEYERSQRSWWQKMKMYIGDHFIELIMVFVTIFGIVWKNT
jgi:hypothetical protein